MSSGTENLYTALLKVYGRQYGKNWSPCAGETQILFCPYALLEEVKDKFQFLQRDEKFLYNIILNLPFDTE